MTKLDDIAGRAAARLRNSVGEHLEDHLAPTLRQSAVPRPALFLALVLVVAVGATLLSADTGGGTRVRTANEPQSAAKRFERAGGSELDPPNGAGSGQHADAASGGELRPAGSGGRPSTATTLPGQSPPSADTGNEPASTDTLFGTCAATFNSGSVGQQREPWCVDGASHEPTPEGRRLEAVVCREPSAGDATLNFDLRQEADFKVVDSAGREVWRWTRTRRPVAHPHERTVKAGACVSWVVLWDDRDQSGNPVPAGTYRLHVSILAEELLGYWKHVDPAIQIGR